MPQVGPHSARLSGTAAGPSRFESTAWTMIAHAQEGHTEASRQYLGLLIQRYWRPVYHFLKCMGRSHEDAKDLTQGFFTKFLEKDAIKYADKSRGRFRNFMVGSVKRYVAQEHRAAAVRPEERAVADFDTALQEQCFGIPEKSNPETEFTRNWLKCVVENSLSILRKECVALGKSRQFQVFKARFLGSSDSPSHAHIAALLGLSEKEVENLLYRARRRFRRIFLAEIRNSTETIDQAQEEVQELLAELGG
jgi:RNA polymerase sigma factor (sigma-70 family)